MMSETFYNIFGLASFIAFLVFLVLYISDNKKLKNVKYKITNLENYNKNLSKLYDDISCFKHDFDNIVTTIGGYICSKDINGLSKYYKTLESECISINNLKVLNPNLINDPGVYNLMIKKHQMAEKLNVNISYEFLLDITDLHMDIFEFTRILGILLDNAIEAASTSLEKQVLVSFRNEFNNNRQVIIIENSYDNKEIDINSIFDKNKTSKEGHHGLGLYKINSMLNKNKNLNLYTSKNDKFFKQQLEIYYE